MDLEGYLEPGRVLHLFCRFPQGVDKYKLLVLADNDEECLFFVINSRINTFIEGKEHLLNQQIQLSSADCRFLSHDSWLACHEVHSMKREEVLWQIENDPDKCLRDHIGDSLKQKIVKVVRNSLTLTPTDKELIIASLSA